MALSVTSYGTLYKNICESPCHTIGKVILAPKLYGKKKKNQKAQHDLMQSNYNLQAAH